MHWTYSLWLGWRSIPVSRPTSGRKPWRYAWPTQKTWRRTSGNWLRAWRRRFQALQKGKADLLNRRLVRISKTSFFRKKQSGFIPMLKSIARRVHRFIYPEYYTVELEELRNPSLLESLRTLQRMVLEFQEALAKSGINRR